jgi:hypothetical protein
MVVLDINKCEKCKDACNSIHFQQNFTNWTSGNDDVDKFIQNSQLLAHKEVSDILEWIPYNRLYNIKHVKFDIYGANWIDGCIRQSLYSNSLNSINQHWIRVEPNMFVNLKLINNPTSIISEFINKVCIINLLFDNSLIYF